MMKILFVVPNPPSLVRVRPYNLIRYLAERGHQITLATVWSSAEEVQDIEHLRALGLGVLAAPLRKTQIMWNLCQATLSGRPLQATFCDTAELRTLLGRSFDGATPAEPQPFDVVHVEHLRGARYGLFIQKMTDRRGIPVVWDSVDCISHLFRQAATRSRSSVGRLMARFELGRTQRYEGWLVDQFDRVLVTSAVDKQALDALSPPGENGTARPAVAVLPNGVDLDYFAPNLDGRDPDTVLFSGKMSYHANLTAALYLLEEVMPTIWQQQPQTKVIIAGKDPPTALQQLAKTLPNVEVTGTVPDLRPYLQRATVAVSPIVYGAGIQNKVLEAMACATPTVASTQAASALNVVDGEHLLLADNTEAFIRHLLRLLTDAQSRRCLSRGGRAYVEKYHSWKHIASDLEGLYADAVERKRSL